MADNYGVWTGVGTGLSRVGQALQGYADRRNAERDKAADLFEKQASDIAANIAQMGGAQAPGAAPYVQQLYGIVQKHNALYAPHETPALIARIGKFVGKRPGAPRQDPRAAMTPEGMIAAAPRQLPGRQQMDLQTEIAQIAQARRAAYPDETDEERNQKAFEAAMGSKQGPRPTNLQKVTQAPYLNKNDGKYYEAYIDPSDPEHKLIPIEVPGYTPPAKGPTAKTDYAVKRAPGGRPDSLTMTVDGVTHTYTSDDMGKEDTPDVVKARWDTLMKNWQEDVAATDQRIRARQQFQIDQQARGAAIQNERMDKEIVKQVNMGQIQQARTMLNASEKLKNDTKTVYDLGVQAAKADNAQADYLFLKAALATSGAANAGRGLNQGMMDSIAERGSLHTRLAGLYERTLGGQKLEPEVRANLIEYLKNEYNDRLGNWAQEKSAYDDAVANAMPQKPGASNTPTKPRVKFGNLPQ